MRPRDVSREVSGKDKKDILCCLAGLGSWDTGSSYKWAALYSCAQEQLLCTAQEDTEHYLQVA